MNQVCSLAIPVQQAHPALLQEVHLQVVHLLLLAEYKVRVSVMVLVNHIVQMVLFLLVQILNLVLNVLALILQAVVLLTALVI